MNYRSDFPVFSERPNLVYLDSAATTQKPAIVIETINQLYRTGIANIHRGLYPLSLDTTAAYEHSRELIAKFIGAKSPEIIFTRGATESINLVAASLTFYPGDEVIVSAAEHHANLIPWQQRGLTLKFLELTSAGEIDLEMLPDLLSEKTRLVAITHCSNVLGHITPIVTIAEILRQQGSDALLLVDASQTAPHVPLSVSELGADFLVLSGHKLYGPSGTGVLWGRAELLESLPPYQTGGEMIQTVTRTNATWNAVPWKFEAGTPNIEGVIGMGAAISYLQTIGMQAVATHTANLHHYAVSQMSEFHLLSLASPESGILAFTIPNLHPHDLAEALGKQDICIRAGHHCAAPLHETLGIPASTRISFGLYTNEADIDRFIAATRQIITEYA